MSSSDYSFLYEEARASLLSFYLEARTPRIIMSAGPTIKTVLGDEIVWDKLKLPLKGCSNKDPTQLWRCRKHKRIEAKCLLSLPRGSSFLDCGSHFGDTTLTMAVHARANGREDIRFIAFEPSRRKCKFIRSMVIANGLENSVRIVNCCVGDVCRTVRPIPEKGVERYDGRVAYSANHNVASTVVDGSMLDDGCNGLLQKQDNVFYFDATCLDHTNQHDSDSESESDDESNDDDDDDDDDNMGEVRMISLDLMQNEILPLGILHLDVEGWEAKALKGAKEILCQVNNTCYIIAEVWSEKDRKMRRRASPLLHSNGCDPQVEILNFMNNHSQFHRREDIVDQERNLFFQWMGVNNFTTENDSCCDTDKG